MNSTWVISVWPPASHRNDFGFGNVFLFRRLEVSGYGRWQGRDFELGTQRTDIAFDIADGDIELMFARFLLNRGR